MELLGYGHEAKLEVMLLAEQVEIIGFPIG